MDYTRDDYTDRTAGQPGMVTASFKDRDSAERAYDALIRRGYTKDEITVMMSDDTRNKQFKNSDYAGDKDKDTDLGNKALEGTGVGSAIGGTLGAIVGAIAAVGTSLAIPGLGLIIAGPIAAGLAGAGAGGLAGGLVGALVGSGIPEEHAKVYKENIEKGGIVMGFHPRTQEDAQHFESEFRNYNGEHVYR